MVLDGLGDDVSAVDVVVEKLVAPEMLVVTNVEILVDYFVAVMLVEVQDGWDDGDVVAEQREIADPFCLGLQDCQGCGGHRRLEAEAEENHFAVRVRTGQREGIEW